MLRLAFLILLPLLALRPVAAADLPSPTGPVILTVSGQVAHTNGDGVAAFDAAMLQALPQIAVESYTDWTEGLQTFEGVLLRDLLDVVGAKGTVISAAAINDYAYDLPWDDLKSETVVLAMKHNGAPMSVRSKGPIWIIYQDTAPSAGPSRPHSAKMIWQLNRLEVR